MKKKLCPLSIIGYKGNIMECVEKECMFWNEQTKPQICELLLWLQWSTKLNFLESTYLDPKLFPKKQKPTTPQPPDKSIT